MKNKKIKFKIEIVILALIIFGIFFYILNSYDVLNKLIFSNNVKNNKIENINILSSSENKDFEQYLKEFANKNNINLNFEYAGNLDIIEKINVSSKDYDVVWNSNSIWNYMLEDSSVLTDSISVSTNPIVFAVKESKARELGFIKEEIYLNEIVDKIRDGSLKFSMANPTQTNSGASTYLGMLSVFSGNPEVLKSEHINNQELKTLLVDFFSNLNRSSGSEDFLEEIILNEEYNAVATYEFSIINLNKELEKQGKETFFILYPVDGVSISDSPFAYVDNKDENKKEAYNKLKNFMLSEETKAILENLGRRTWYGGITSVANQDVFKTSWGINTNEYIVPIKYPHTEIIKEALSLYQNEFRKPIMTVFGLDYSGSMLGENKDELVKAMEFILSEQEASKNYIQFTEKDHIAVIPFNSDVIDVWGIYTGDNTEELLDKIRVLSPSGSTNIYDTTIKALDIVNKYNEEEYNRSVILMTDGISNRGSFSSLSEYYYFNKINIPVYSIVFGDADNTELSRIEILTNGKVFDGKSDLLRAFKEVRGYN